MPRVFSHRSTRLVIGGHEIKGLADDDQPVVFSAVELVKTRYGEDGKMYSIDTGRRGGDLTVKLHPAAPSVAVILGWFNQKQRGSRRYFDGYYGDHKENYSVTMYKGSLKSCPPAIPPGQTFTAVFGFERIIPDYRGVESDKVPGSTVPAPAPTPVVVSAEAPSIEGARRSAERQGGQSSGTTTPFFLPEDIARIRGINERTEEFFRRRRFFRNAVRAGKLLYFRDFLILTKPLQIIYLAKHGQRWGDRMPPGFSIRIIDPPQIIEDGWSNTSRGASTGIKFKGSFDLTYDEAPGILQWNHRSWPPPVHPIHRTVKIGVDEETLYQDDDDPSFDTEERE